MQLNEFNQLDTAEAKQILKNCVHIPSWIDNLSQARPYQSLASLESSARENIDTWTWREVEETLVFHPRIGEKKAANHLSEKEQNFSAKEQSAVDLSEDTSTALYQGNVDYEQKFGFIFLIRAAGRSAEQILAELQRRLSNDLQTEQAEVIHQLGEIALLRLQSEVQA
ncbi:2-oxo-4-hydroxy-4-carboxy-5-ureidoimidazoline decarboxylase [Acinetobacter marinus]|uniref:2-oxo-4-hydroxy-4-carboxy-5-ureidoimidazoline decarboxylase n=1 Tax=Acinetobacter marinus TaxID=281375 RepID=A0A1G6JN63_9GAMM|nr:2-oxo-4-hydroxy-4-carboxy-5-ureidoimidazoline decarboxylase [Acinetobacter marinus]SDC20143.1 2-oxo-4-hydroxy-4-carboxy-5-ureidoimidazoline decarboxylase [Acinetobacter marinus]